MAADAANHFARLEVRERPHPLHGAAFALYQSPQRLLAHIDVSCTPQVLGALGETRRVLIHAASHLTHAFADGCLRLVE